MDSQRHLVRRLKSSLTSIKSLVCRFPRIIYRLLKRRRLVSFIIIVFTVIITLNFLFRLLSEDSQQQEPHLHNDAVTAHRQSTVATVLLPWQQSSTTITQQTVAVPSYGTLGRPLLFLTFSYHATPVADIGNTLAPVGVRIADWGPNAYGCRYFGNCRTLDPLKVWSYERISEFGINDKQIEELYAVYSSDSDWQAVDAFICFYPVATCELFQLFNKTTIILTTGRYDFSRPRKREWGIWNQRLRALADVDGNVIAANNYYDAAYLRYYTGINPLLIPSQCGYASATYNPTRPGFLLGLRSDPNFRRLFVDLVSAVCRQHNVTVTLTPIRTLYSTYSWTDLASHRGVVALPSSPSSYTLIELYRMNVPLFLPAKKLLIEFQQNEAVPMFTDLYSHMSSDPVFPQHSDAIRADKTRPDPNLRDASPPSNESLDYWLGLSDWYTDLMPHAVLYESVYQLVQLLNRTMTDDKLRDVSRRMAEDNRLSRQQTGEKWAQILEKVAAVSTAKKNTSRTLVITTTTKLTTVKTTTSLKSTVRPSTTTKSRKSSSSNKTVAAA